MRTAFRYVATALAGVVLYGCSVPVMMTRPVAVPRSVAVAPAHTTDLVFNKTKILRITGNGEKEIQATVRWGNGYVAITPKSQLEREIYPDLTMRVPYSSMSNLEYSNSKHWRVAAAILFSPWTLFSKRKHHYFSFTYEKGAGKRDAVILRIDKKEEKSYRKRVPLITGLELTELAEE